MYMGMRHCLPGKLTVRLREADSSRLRHIAAGTHDLGDHPRLMHGDIFNMVSKRAFGIGEYNVRFEPAARRGSD
jgi:hypothetical protein